MIDVHKSKLVLEQRKKCLFPIPLVVETNPFHQYIFSILRSFHSLSRIFHKILIELFELTLTFFFLPTWNQQLFPQFGPPLGRYSNSTTRSFPKKKKKYPFQRTKKGDPFQEESPIPNNSKSFLETWILLSPRKDHGRNSKVLPCPWPWLKRVTVHFYSRWPVRHVIRYKGSATKRGRQAL